MAAGLYQFNGLPPGDYTVRVDASTLPIGVNPTADYDGMLNHETTYSLVFGEVFDGLDFGYAGTASVGDLVFPDLDADGSRDPARTTSPASP